MDLDQRDRRHEELAREHEARAAIIKREALNAPGPRRDELEAIAIAERWAAGWHRAKIERVHNAETLAVFAACAAGASA